MGLVKSLEVTEGLNVLAGPELATNFHSDDLDIFAPSQQNFTDPHATTNDPFVLKVYRPTSTPTPERKRKLAEKWTKTPARLDKRAKIPKRPRRKPR